MKTIWILLITKWLSEKRKEEMRKSIRCKFKWETSLTAPRNTHYFGKCWPDEIKIKCGKRTGFSSLGEFGGGQKKMSNWLRDEVFSFCGEKEEDCNVKIKHFGGLRLTLFQHLRLFLHQWLLRKL